VKIDVYVDASFKSPQEKDLKPRDGHIFFCNGHPLAWYYKRQPLTSLSKRLLQRMKKFELYFGLEVWLLNWDWILSNLRFLIMLFSG